LGQNPAISTHPCDSGWRAAVLLIRYHRNHAGKANTAPAPPRQALLSKHRALLIADEVQTGLARTGKMLCQHWDGIKVGL
jgi:hypothetical protein